MAKEKKKKDKDSGAKERLKSNYSTITLLLYWSSNSKIDDYIETSMPLIYKLFLNK